jgi:hypothetical protein
MPVATCAITGTEQKAESTKSTAQARESLIRKLLIPNSATISLFGPRDRN